MIRFGSFFLASVYSLMLKIIVLMYNHVHRSKSSLAEENGSNFSENRSRLDDDVFSKNPNVVIDGNESNKSDDFIATAESSVLLQTGLVSKSSKCQILCGENVSGFLELEKPTTHKFVVQELFVGSDYVVFSSDDQTLASETWDKNGLFDQNLDDDRKEFDEEESEPSPFYFKLFNASFSTIEETVVNESEMESRGLCGEEKEVDEKKETPRISDFRVEDEDSAYEVELTSNIIPEIESIDLCGGEQVDEKKDTPEFSDFRVEDEDSAYEVELTSNSIPEEMGSIGLCGEEQVDEKKETSEFSDFRVEDEDFVYEVELIPSSRVADQESDGISISLEKVEKNDSENWMSDFLDETDHTKSGDAMNLCEEMEDLDDEFIEWEMDKESVSSSCADANKSEEFQGQNISSQEGQNCWDSDFDADEDEPDVLSEHQHLVQQMKMELKNCRIRGLPTISEESETPKMAEDLKPLQIDHKIGYKDVMEGIQKFYKSYTEKMRKLDILNYQTSHAINFLQLKESDVYRASKKKGNNSSSLAKMWHGKVRRIYADPMHKSMNDLELVYVGQMCLSWEILWWLDARARELLEYDDGEGRHSYNRAAEDFQQFQVLLQRFMEDEQFQGRTRNDNYVRSRCMIRSLLQVPTIKDDCLKTNKGRREEADAVSLPMLVETIRESMLVFQEFVFADKKATNAHVLTKIDVQESEGSSEILLDVVSTLHKKERRIREHIRSQNCIVQRLKKHQERRSEWDREIVASQVELRLVCRVLNMSRFSKDQLVWCQKKLNSISFVGRKVQRETSFLLFPC